MTSATKSSCLTVSGPERKGVIKKMHTLSLFERLLSAGCPGALLPSCLSATIKLFDLPLDGLPKFHFCSLPICFPLSVSRQMTAQSLKTAAYKHTHARLTALLCRTMNLHAVLQLTSLCNRLQNLQETFSALFISGSHHKG